MKSYWIAALLSTLLLPGCEADEPTSEQAATTKPTASAREVTIYRDAYGTPHVVAQTNRGVYYGYGYAVATDRLFQMEMLRRTTQGRVAEVLGRDYLELDSHLRTAYDHRNVRLQLDRLPAAQREILAAYAAGFNARLDEILEKPGELLPIEFSDHDFLPARWTDYDVAMLFSGSIAHRYSDFNSERDNLELLQALEAKHGKNKAWRIFNASKWLLDASSPTTVPRASVPIEPRTRARPAYLDELSAAAPNKRVALAADGKFLGTTHQPKLLNVARQRIASHGFSHNPEYVGASNYWAVADLQDGRAALVNGPQFGFSAPSYVYGIGLHGGDFNVVGNTLLALPAMLFAHNNNIAWGSTAGMSDQSDEYRLQVHPEDPRLYRHGDGWQAFESWTESISVRGAETVTVVARRAAQGMVQAYHPETHSAWVRARTWEGRELATLMAWVFLATDTDLDAAHARVADMATNINIYTMDKAGNLGYVHSGRYPVRAEGHDPRLPAPGSGQWDWQGLHPYADNPTVRNPEQGYIANWNNRAGPGWISSDLWTSTWGRADRTRLLFDALERRPSGGGGKHSVASVREINRQIAFADVNAPFLLPFLFQAWASETPSEQVSQALAQLRAWDGQWNVDSEGNYGPLPALMETWLRLLLAEVFEDDIGDDFYHLYAATNYPNSPLGPSMGTPPGLKAMVRNLDRLAGGDWSEADYDFFNGESPSELLRTSFSSALQTLSAAQGGEFDNWRLSAAPMQWQPYNFRGVPQARETSVYTLPGYMNRGSENNVFVARGTGITAWDAIPPGQSGFQSAAGENRAARENQLQMYAEFAYKPVPFSVQEVRDVAQTSQTLTMDH